MIERKAKFIKHLTQKYPDIHIAEVLKVIDQEFEKILPSSDTVPLTSDLGVDVIIGIIEKINNLKWE